MSIENLNSTQTRRAYDAVASRYDSLFKKELDNKPYDRKLLKRFSEKLSHGSLVYDMGCGPCGHVGRYIQRRGHRVVGVDISPECIRLASLNNPGFSFELMDMANLQVDSNTVDGIVSFYSIIHTPKRQIGKIFDEYNRVLKDDGTLLVVVKGGEGEGRIDSLLDLPVPIHFSHFNETELAAYIRESGFQLDFIKSRKPYDFEINSVRVYAIGSKNARSVPDPLSE